MSEEELLTSTIYKPRRKPTCKVIIGKIFISQEGYLTI